MNVINKITPIFTIESDRFIILDEDLYCTSDTEAHILGIQAGFKYSGLFMHYIGQTISLEDDRVEMFYLSLPIPGEGINVEIGLISGPTFDKFKEYSGASQEKRLKLERELGQEFIFTSGKYIVDNINILSIMDLTMDNDRRALVTGTGIDRETGKPYVLSKIGDTDVPLTVNEARDYAWELFTAAGSAIEDAFMFRYLKDSKEGNTDSTEARDFISAFRNYRDDILHEHLEEREQLEEESETDTA